MLDFDRLVRRQHEIAEASWVVDGSPAGFFWHFWDAHPWSRQRAFWRYLVSTPAWLLDDSAFRVIQRRMRIEWLSALVIFIGWLVALVLTSAPG